jgi:L-ascorbate metabolism protein UlaG (beta-lactamase superfamily)
MNQKISKRLKKIMIILLSMIGILAIVVFAYTKQAKFGKAPEGQRLRTIQKSPNFKDGKFQNQHFTLELAEGFNFFDVTYEFLFKEKPRRYPTDSIPSMKTDLFNIPIEKNILVWFGHSSYFMQIDGKRMLIDPVFSGNASPIPNTNKAFKGTERYQVADIPPIDYLFITHDHYDHLDYETIIALKSKVKMVLCGLGVGAHLEYWGYEADKIIEKDWNEQINLEQGFTVYTAPARHFSGRGFDRNNTLWLSFLLQTPSKKIYIGGDSGYDTHFSEIGNKHNHIDLAILDNGQYDIKWKYIHNLPTEVLQATKDLKAQRLFPVHSSKFVMANHAWDEPLVKVTALNQSFQIPLVTPLIGEMVDLDDEKQVFKQWWIGIN